MEQSRTDPEVIAGLGELSTSTISDTLDRLGFPGGCKGITPGIQGVKMAGPAYTVRYVPVGETRGTVGDYIDEMQPGEVAVLDNNGRTDCTVWGDILTVVAKQKGIAGTVIDGVFRDLPRILEERYPIFSRGRFMMTGKDRVMVEATQVTVSIGTVQVRPGDVLVGDDSGVVVVPQEIAAKVLEIARGIEEAEAGIVRAVQGGMSVGEARKQFGYHSLQTRRE